MHSLGEPLLKPCLPNPVRACPKVVDALRTAGIAAAESALTGRIARVQGRSVAVGDIVLYKAGHDTRVGEVCFHAMVRGHVIVCLSHWPTVQEKQHFRKAVVKENYALFPSECMLHSCIYTPATVGHQSTVLLPAI